MKVILIDGGGCMTSRNLMPAGHPDTLWLAIAAVCRPWLPSAIMVCLGIPIALAYLVVAGARER